MTGFEPVPPIEKAVCDRHHTQAEAAARVAAPAAIWERLNSEGDSAKQTLPLRKGLKEAR